METATAQDVVKWLESLLGMKSVKPGRIVLDGQTYVAARYLQEHEPPAGQQAHSHECIYILGERPKKMCKSHWALTMAGDTKEWYVSTYMEPENYKMCSDEIRRIAHPFGLSFIIAPWDVPGEKIDQYEKNPYKRIDVLWEELA